MVVGLVGGAVVELLDCAVKRQYEVFEILGRLTVLVTVRTPQPDSPGNDAEAQLKEDVLLVVEVGAAPQPDSPG
jgi:hypothetical protein